MLLFLLAYIFWRSGLDMLSQNFQVSSDYACDMLIFVCFPNFLSLFKGSLSQGSLICLLYAYIFSTSEPEYAYKRYAYKKNMYCMVW